MAHLLGLSGSLRSGSYNGLLLRAARALVPPGSVLEIGTIAGIPLYDGDAEAKHGLPDPVKRLKERIVQADGLVLVTPEYNHSIPGVFKNAIDWLSRPASDIPRVFGEKPVVVIGATTGGGGTRLSQAAWSPVLRTLGTRAWSGKLLYVQRAQDVFDGAGGILDSKVKRLLTELLAGFVAFVEESARPAPGADPAHAAGPS